MGAAACGAATVGSQSPGDKMKVLYVRDSKVALPTGNPNFKVMQPFPSAVPAEEADPYLMCDLFGPMPSKGVETDPDKFMVDWHPHKGMDICTYMLEGVGRHADSLGNRESWATPGLQWCSTGSGIEHAEGGGTPAGENTTGFQIWVNVPSARKNDDPRYGTVPPEKLPVLQLPNNVHARVVSGRCGGVVGPFETVQPLQMVDFVLPAGALLEHDVPENLDNCLAFVYQGSLKACGHEMKKTQVARFDAAGPVRTLAFQAGAEGAAVMLFAGKRLNQPIAWHGPFVMTTQAEIRQTFVEFQQGKFPPKRVPWDYQRLSAFPPDHPARAQEAH